MKMTRAALLRAAGVAGATGVTAAMAGCTPGGDSGTGTAASSAPAQLHVLFQGGAENATFEKIIERFRATAPHIQVEFEGVGNANQFVEKGLALAAGGTPPDLSGGNPRFHMAFFSAGALLDANEVSKRERLDLKDVPKNLMDDPAWKGKLLMLPAVFEPALVYYNKALFERAGRPDPGQLWSQKRWTWAAFTEAARALHPQPNADGALPHLGYELRTWDGELFSVVRSHGGDVLSADRTRFILDEAAGVEALTQWSEQAARHKITPPAVPLPQGGFNAGRVALRYAVPSNVQATRDARSKGQAAWGWDVAPTPTDRSHRPTLFVGGYGIWNNPKQAAQAATFLKYLLGKEAMLMRAELSSRMPSRASLLPEFGKLLNLPQEDPKSLVKAVEESLAGARGLPHTPTFPTWRDVLEKQVLLPVLQGQVTVRDALQSAKTAITAELAKS